MGDNNFCKIYLQFRRAMSLQNKCIDLPSQHCAYVKSDDLCKQYNIAIPSK